MGPEDSDPPDYPEALGRTIRIYRAARNLARRVLAEQADVSYSYLAEIEKGAKYPSAKALHAIAKALGLSPAELLTASETLEAPEEPAQSPPPHPEGARARQKLWFHGRLPMLKPRAAEQQDLRLHQDWEPDLDRLLAELRALLREMPEEDRQHVLELVRRLAKR